jgi:16S rRNA (cytosine967-C5)-methyltransferase
VTSREAAVEVLRRVREDRTFASEAFDQLPELPPLERRLALTLAYGVIRRRATLDALLRPFVNRPLDAVDPAILDVLHLGAFQLALLDAIPPHAAVHEAVELVRFVRQPRATGLVNGVLRRVAELVTDHFADSPSTSTLPVDLDRRGRARYRKLRQPMFAPPPSVDYLAEAFSWPDWLAARWWDRFGFDECTRLGFWFNAPPPLWIRVNGRLTTRSGYARLRPDAEPGDMPMSLRLDDAGLVTKLPGFEDGWFAVQDHASQAVVEALNPQPGWRVLDLCAAPGGKTTHLAERMDNQGSIVACDIDTERLATVTTLCQRMQATIVETVLVGEADRPPPGPFDAALVDAPCSNTGVLGRRPEVRWRVKPHEIPYLIALQTRLLNAAIDRVRPGGVVVYSTCSIEADENRGVVDRVLRDRGDVRLDRDAWAIPGRPSDGGYWARLIR